MFPKLRRSLQRLADRIDIRSHRRTITDERDLDLVGREGEAVSDLRPAGFARIAGRRVDVVSRGESIEAGATVRVLEVSGNRVVVMQVQLDPSNTNDPASDGSTA